VRAPVGGLGPVAGLLGVRAYRGRYVPPFALLHGGRAWRLSSALIGSEFCGHQIALASHGHDQTKWALYDADAVRDRIGPLAWDMGEGAGQAKWWEALEWLVPMMNATESSSFCDMNPRNRHPSEPLAAAFGAAGDRAAQALMLGMGQGPRTVNVDWIYTEAPPGTGGLAGPQASLDPDASARGPLTTVCAGVRAQQAKRGRSPP